MLFSFTAVTAGFELAFALIALASNADPLAILLSHLPHSMLAGTLASIPPSLFAANRAFSNRAIGFPIMTMLWTLAIAGAVSLLPADFSFVSLADAPPQAEVFLKSGDVWIKAEAFGDGFARSVTTVDVRATPPVGREGTARVTRDRGSLFIGTRELDREPSPPAPGLATALAAAFVAFEEPFRASPGWPESLAMAAGTAMLAAGLWGFTRLSGWPLANLAILAWACLGAFFLQGALGSLLAWGPPIPDLARAYPEYARAILQAALGLLLFALDLLLVRRTGAVDG